MFVRPTLQWDTGASVHGWRQKPGHQSRRSRKRPPSRKCRRQKTRGTLGTRRRSLSRIPSVGPSPNESAHSRNRNAWLRWSTYGTEWGPKAFSFCGMQICRPIYLGFTFSQVSFRRCARPTRRARLLLTLADGLQSCSPFACGRRLRQLCSFAYITSSTDGINPGDCAEALAVSLQVSWCKKLNLLNSFVLKLRPVSYGYCISLHKSCKRP